MDRCGWEAAIAGHGIQLLPIGAELPSPSDCRMLPWTSAFEDGFTDSMATIGVPYVVASRDSVDLTVCGRPMEIRQCLADGLGAVVWNTVSGPWILLGLWGVAYAHFVLTCHASQARCFASLLGSPGPCGVFLRHLVAGRRVLELGCGTGE